ncbi:cyclodeaminase/cyclohydrolase family protein [Slackia exigua]|uniref:Methenyltetrahydrofolate cyclohydrolase n=1 Tax=Slackia exigua (strain ATCC 700122 / DSM 15923 / CIP 105133 / JCM 11022 / KCTC 5966 / S-7) TaxID=649764 RepID=D0WGH7_SLAES|nr:cyclodeaminase/cyclohydrolase family protein [Slackia exigua]EEZ61590.1 putative methenyltetrahydrofolate cyclohydrolase [Slackia exigua ATCC 700122]STN99199.1 Methenyltetrahydrofolate cyclohydrolase [Slackia exigua]
MPAIDETFLNELASDAPAPGGGGASAYVGALSAALASMVIAIAGRKRAYESIAGKLQEQTDMLASCREALVGLVEEDAVAFGALAATWKMPKSTPEERVRKSEAQQEALVGACEVPMQIMRICAKVIEIDHDLIGLVDRMILSDVGASVIIALGAMKAAALNVRVNAAYMKDADAAQAYLGEVDDMIRTFEYSAQVVYDFVKDNV